MINSTLLLCLNHTPTIPPMSTIPVAVLIIRLTIVVPSLIIPSPGWTSYRARGTRPLLLLPPHLPRPPSILKGATTTMPISVSTTRIRVAMQRTATRPIYFLIRPKMAAIRNQQPTWTPMLFTTLSLSMLILNQILLRMSLPSLVSQLVSNMLLNINMNMIIILDMAIY